MAAEINEIISKEAIEGVKQLDKYISSADESLLRMLGIYKELNTVLAGSTQKDYNNAVKAMNTLHKEAVTLTQKKTAAEREADKVAKSLAAQEAKLAAKEKERNDALKLQVKSIEDATRQNKALREVVKTLDTTTQKGRDTLKQYNRQIDDNTKFIRQNSDADKQRLGGIGKYTQAILRAGAALGITVGAGKAFQYFLNSTDALSDKFAETVGGLREGLNFFAKSLTSLDFNNFLTGLSNAIRAGREYVAELDRINDRTRALGIIQSQDRQRLAELLIIQRDVTKSADERIAAGKEILSIELKNSEIAKGIAADSEKTELKKAATLTGLSQDRIKQLLIEQETNKDLVAAAQAYNDALAAQRKAQAGASGGSMYGQTTNAYVSKETQRILKETPQDIKNYAAELRSFGKLSEEEYNKIAESIKGVGEANAQFAETTSRVQRGLSKLNKGILDDEEEAAAKARKEQEKQKTAIELLTEKVKLLRDELSNTLLKGGNTDGIVRQIMGSEAELNRVKEQVDELTKSIERMASKGYKTVTNPFTGEKTIANLPTSGANTGLLRPRTATGGTAAQGAAGTNTIGWTSADTIEATQTTADAIFTIISNSDQAAFDHKMSLLEREKQAKLNNSKLTEKQRAKIEADYAKKQAKLKEEQFRKEKAASIIQAIINTAIAVTKASPNVPQMILAGVVGAAQIGIIASQKVPEFDQGSTYTPHTFIAGERRPEWVRGRSGVWRYVDRPTMFKNMAGSTVVSGAETERLRQAGLKPAQTDIRPELNAMRKDIVEAVKNKRELSISARGDRITNRDGNYNKEYFNRRIQWAGKKH